MNRLAALPLTVLAALVWLRLGPLAALDVTPPPDALTRGTVWIAGTYAGLPPEARSALPPLLENVPRIDVATISHAVSRKPAVYEVSAQSWNAPFTGSAEAMAAVAGIGVRYLWSVPTRTLAPVLDNATPVTLAANVSSVAATRTVIYVPAALLASAPEPAFARLRLDLPLKTAPIVGVNYSTLPATGRLGGIVNVRKDGKLFHCRTPFAPSYQIEVASAVIACLGDASRARVDSVDLDFVSNDGSHAAKNPGVVSVAASWLEGGQDAAPLQNMTVRSDVETVTAYGSAGAYFLKDPRNVTVTFDPRAVRVKDTIRIAAVGLPVERATLGHVNDAGTFVADGDVTQIFSYTSLGLRREDLPPRRVAVKFIIAPGPQSTHYFGISVTVTKPSAARLTVTAGSRVADVTHGGPQRLAPGGMPIAVDVSDRTGATSIASIGAPAVRAHSTVVPDRTLPVFATVPASDSYVTLRQAYSPWWLAFCLAQCSAAHYGDISGWNTWLVNGSGTVVITNGAVLLQILAALASFLFLAYAAIWRYKRTVTS